VASLLRLVPFLVLLALPTAGEALTLYDVDFEAPTHTEGSLPTTGAGSGLVSSVRFGAPVVVADASGGQALLFDGHFPSGFQTFSHEQIVFDLGVAADLYRIEFSLFVDNLTSAADDFSVLFDAPLSTRISFRGDDQIWGRAASGQVGTYDPDLPLSVRVEADRIAAEWRLFVNGSFIGDQSWSNAGTIDTVRLNLERRTIDGDSLERVFLDDVVIQAVPEPGTLLLLLGFTSLACARRSRLSGA
jgi:hypothetical protein